MFANFCSTSLVSINTLNNYSSGCANYSDYTSIYTELQTNNTYTLTIGLENCSGFSTPKISNVYIDWNANELFEANEEVFHINSTSASVTETMFSTEITVPSNAEIDTILMRVVTVWSLSDNANDYSCGIYTYGETEDYSLIIRGLINTISTADNLCYGDSNGVINIIPSFNNSNLSYSINGGDDYYSSSTFENLPSGIYNVSVYDSVANLTQNYWSNPVIISSPDPLYAEVNTEGVSCYGFNDGSISAIAYNGTPNYIYNWTNGSEIYSTNNINNLPSGYYSLNLEDLNGCMFELDSVFVNSPEKLVFDSVSISSFQGYGVSCNGGDNGFINVYSSGGTGSHLYNWNGNVSSNPYLENLEAGNISLVIFDNNFCQNDTLISISEPDSIELLTNILHVGCENENDGSITTNIIGGVSPYSIEVYSTSLNQSQLNSDGYEIFQNLDVNNYTLSVIDQNFCLHEKEFYIENPNLSLYTKDIKCFGNEDGEIIFSVDFSTDVYSLISPASTTNLSAGTYDFLIQNNQGCFFDTVIEINEPPFIEVKESVSIICNDFDYAEVLIEADGGVPSYRINWNQGDTIFNPLFEIGVYDYTILDANNCSSSGSIEVLPPNIPQLSYTLSEPSCEYNFDASINISVVNGYPPYEFNWEDGKNGAFIENLSPKSYRLVVNDSAMCSSKTLEVVVPYVKNPCFFIPDAFTPNYDGVNDNFEISSIFSRSPIVLTIYNRQGTIVYKSENKLLWDGRFKNQKCQQGKYYYHLQYSNQYLTGEVLLLN